MKKGLLLLLVVFLGFYLFTDPSGLAGMSKSAASGAWDGISTVFKGIIRFLNALSG